MPNDHPSLENVNYGANPPPSLENQVKVLLAFQHWLTTQILPQLTALCESNQQNTRDLVTHLQAFNSRLSLVEDKLFTPHDPI